MTILSVSGLSKSFGGLHAVSDMAFRVEQGEILGLIGPNGSGKSTTLSLLMGIIRPDKGSVRFRDSEVCNWPTQRIANHGIAMVFQHSRPLKRQTVLENIQLALLPNTIFQLFPPQETVSKAREIAERVGLGQVVEQYPGSLAYADLRRLELAKAIALNPSVILLDEPFAGLAPGEVGEFSELTMSFREEGHAVVLVDHNVKAVSSLVDRAIAMHAGKKIAEGTPQEVTNDERVREIYLGGSLQDSSQAAAKRRQPRNGEGVAGSAPMLEMKIESVRYGKAQALREFKAQVHQGEFVSVVGLNGAGKSTLFKSIMGFIAYDGDVQWQGTSFKGKRPAAISASGIAMCPETRELFRYLSVRENLEMGVQRLSRKDLDRRLDQVFELFPVLKERQKQTADTLSGGEQQQLTIGRALMQKPRLLILDEPTLGLAPLVIEDISKALDVLQEETGLTILLGEQNLTFALKHSDRIYLLETGDITWQGNTSAFLREVGSDFL